MGGRLKGYNTLHVRQGDITEPMLQLLTAAFQKQVGLTVDGFCGPKTRVLLMERIARRRAVQRVTTSPRQDYIKRVLAIAEAEIGKGEDPKLGNNLSGDISRYRRGDGTGRPPNKPQEWCASFVSYCFLKAARDLGYPAPFKGSRGARHLGEMALEKGTRLSHPEKGALVVWKRGVLRQGHIGVAISHEMVTDELVTIEGNKRAKGKRFAYVERFTYPQGSWRKKLLMIVRVR